MEDTPFIFYQKFCREVDGCNLCNSQTRKLLFIKQGYKYFICKDCGLVYIRPQPTRKQLVNIYDNLSEEYFTLESKIRSDFSRSYKDILDSLDKFKQNNRLLEVGCSTGSLLLEAKAQGWDTFGAEISRRSAEYGINKHGLNIFIGDLIQANFPDEYFDVVLFIQTLEHLPDPNAHIKECQRILRKGGVVFISVPNFSGLTTTFLKSRYYYVESRHLFYFTPHTLRMVLENNGFSISKLKTMGLDFFNMLFGNILNVSQSQETQRKIISTSDSFKNKKLFYPIRLLYRLLVVPICFFGKGDSILVYAKKS